MFSNGKSRFKVELGGKKQVFDFVEIGLNVEVFVKIERIIAFSDYQDSDARGDQKEKFSLSELTSKKGIKSTP